jgi:hypothetical protein
LRLPIAQRKIRPSTSTSCWTASISARRVIPVPLGSAPWRGGSHTPHKIGRLHDCHADSASNAWVPPPLSPWERPDDA